MCPQVSRHGLVDTTAAAGGAAEHSNTVAFLGLGLLLR